MSAPGDAIDRAGDGTPGSESGRLTLFIQHHWRTLVLIVPFTWLLLFFLAPFFFVLKISFAETTVAAPPYTPMIEWVDEGIMHLRIVIDNYAYLWEDDLYVTTYLNSIKISSISTVLCLLLGYPIAYAIVRSNHATKHILLMLIILPFWTSFLLRVYAWMGILSDQGLINDLLAWFGMEPLRMLYTQTAVYIGIVYTYVPFMILPLYANLEKLDWEMLEAAADLGARPMTTFFSVTLPMTAPGILAGSLLVFIPATGEYVIPDLLGGSYRVTAGAGATDDAVPAHPG